ncbi:MAG: transcriptional repressor [Phycicoccus sp.]|nr:transcriptional repressor [Phycicoccus sp.]
MTTDFKALLKESGLRVTKQRTTVLDVVGQHPHCDAGTVYGQSASILDAVSRQAIYDCLNTLTEAGLIRRIQPAGSVARYELRTGDNHHHVVCRSCGAVADVDCAVGSAPCLDPSESHGYALTEAEVNYWGICPSCALGATPRGDSAHDPARAQAISSTPKE